MIISILTRSLTRGGAQVQVAALAKGLARRGHVVSVVSFYAGGSLAETVKACGVNLVDLNKSGRTSVFGPLKKLVSHIRQSRAEVIYSFLPMENLFGLAAASITRRPRVWGIRGAGVNRSQYGLASRILYGMQFRFLGCSNAVICNSQAAAVEITARNRSRVHVVPNGIDGDRFAPAPDRRLAWRQDQGIDSRTTLIGIVARLDPMKDHENFLRSAAEVIHKLPDAVFIVAGDGPSQYAESLRQLAEALGIGSRIRWLGEVADPADVYRGLDVLVSASAYGEGFSNALGEAMATGLAVVATDVGDGKLLVGEHGIIVPPRDAHALAEGIVAALAGDTSTSRHARSKWIREQFGVEIMVTRTEGILASVAEKL